MFKIIFLVGIFTASCTQQDMNNKETKVVASEELPQEIIISDDFKSCNQDSDCRIITKLCLCCKFDAINKNYAQKYLDQEKDCKSPPPPCGCKDPKLTPKCIDNKCELK